MGKLDTELRALEGLPEEVPVVAEPVSEKTVLMPAPPITDVSLRLVELTAIIEDLTAQQYWVIQSGNKEDIFKIKEELDGHWDEYNALRGKVAASVDKPASTKSGIDIIDSINNAESIKEIMEIRNSLSRLTPMQSWELYKKINGTELTKLFSAKITSLAKSVTFATISQHDYLIMNDINKFPTSVGLVTRKANGEITVKPIREDGTVDSLRSGITIAEKDLAKQVKNVYSEELTPKAIETVVDKTTEKLSDESIEENKTSSADAKKKAIVKGKTTPLEVLKNKLKKPGC
jgi:hypothetical protein